MTHHHHIINKKETYTMIISILIGIVVGYMDVNFINTISAYLIDIFMNLLKFISLPIIFLSISSSICKFAKNKSFNSIFIKTVTYTLTTTLIAAIIAMLSYFVINPASSVSVNKLGSTEVGSFVAHLLGIVPSNIVQIFLEYNVMAVVFSAFLIGFAGNFLKSENRDFVEKFLSSFFALFMNIAKLVLNLLPYILWAFIALFIKNLRSGFIFDTILLYMLTIIVANVLQAAVILPLFLKFKGVPVINSLKGMMPALITAFFSKSSSATMPTTMHCVENNLKVRKEVASLSVPLCTTINMNACAAFIYITVLFVAQSNGMTFSTSDFIMWVVLAVVAALGNAGVPMGCYFMASAYLSGMDISIYLMGVILPFYTILDMFETAINVWSDACVSLAVNKNYDKKIDE